VGRILIIDDDEQIRFTIRVSLEIAGHEILEAEDGEEGLALYAQDPTDLVITDMLMPGIDGLEVIRRFKETNPEGKVVIMTANQDDLEEAVEMGADFALEKPFSVSELRESVQEVLGETG